MICNHPLESGKCFTPSPSSVTTAPDFVCHPSYTGVALKHLVTGSVTDGSLSSHLVRIKPHCTLETHCHEGRLEIHEILSGTGTATIGDVEANYEQGSIGIIPANLQHSVTAGPDGLLILAKFTPALL